MGVMHERDPLESSDPRYNGKGDGRTPPERVEPADPDAVSPVNGPTMQSADDMLLDQIRGYGVIPGEGSSEDEDDPVDGIAPTDEEVLQFIQQSEPRANEFFQEKAMDKILNVYRAIRNEHPKGSKYQNPLYKNRAQFHRPKSRNAMRRVQTAAANALFAARDAVEITPGDESNPTHRAAAALKKEILNYRLSRKSGRNAIPWFEVAIGGRTDAYLTGYTVSLQTWAYRERVIGKEPILDQYGSKLVDPVTGQVAEKNVYDIIIDRPDVQLYPIENVGIDPAAPWQDPAQGAAFIYLKDPVYMNDLKAVMQQGADHTNFSWRDPEDVDWGAGRVDPNQDARSVRTGRADGQTDRFDDLAGSKETGDGNKLVWRYLWFFRWEGEDFCCYTIGTRSLLTDVIPVAEAFPHLGGQRPVVIGTDVIAPHDLLPMSNASALQPMQAEINDQTNLRIEAIKQSVYPIAKIKRGRGIDAAAITRRGPNTNVLVDEKDDFTFEGIPNGAAALFQEMDRLNNDFDESAGIFSNSSVQGQRAMNETVGGMKILAGDAQAVANLELRIWTETWVERVIAQVMMLCSYYETNSTILSICGTRAELWEKFGVDQITDELLLTETECIVDIGIGANDPNEAIQRISMAFNTVTPILTPQLQSGEVVWKAKEIINEVFGAAQFKDGGDRFVTINDKAPPTDQAMQELQAQLQEAQARIQELEAGKEAQKEIAHAKAKSDLELQKDDHAHERWMFVMEAMRGEREALMANQNAERADMRKGDLAAKADERKGRMAHESAEHKANTAMESDQRKLTMGERAADKANVAKDKQQLIQMAMAGPPAGMGGAPAEEGATPEGAVPPEVGEMGQSMIGQIMAEFGDQLKAEIGGMVQEMTDQFAQQMQAQQAAFIKAINAPRTIVRGPDGKAMGSRVEMDDEPAPANTMRN